MRNTRVKLVDFKLVAYAYYGSLDFGALSGDITPITDRFGLVGHHSPGRVKDLRVGSKLYRLGSISEVELSL